MIPEPQALQNALDKLPTGFAWTRDPTSNWGKLLSAAAQAQVDFETAAEALLVEATPGTTTVLLEDYERVLGPDPCLGPAATFDARRASAHARWTARGGASRAHYIAIAAALGTAIEIEEYTPLRAEIDCAEAPTTDDLWDSVWRVLVPDLTGPPPYLPLDSAQVALLRCNLERRKPAHTVLLFQYAAYFHLDLSPLDGTDQLAPAVDLDGTVDLNSGAVP